MHELPLSAPLDLGTVQATRALVDRRVRMLFWLTALLFGLLQAWNTRHSMNADGISYLDLANAYLNSGWKMLVNRHWSPLYPWLLAMAKFLLKPSSYWEFSVVHFVNFVLYVIAFLAYEFMLREFIASRISGPDSLDADAALPEWALRLTGYLVFFWLSLTLITLERVSPDMLMSIFVYLIVARILNIRRSHVRWHSFALLGLLLGVSYYAKTPMFPLAFIFLGVTLFSAGNLKQALPRVLIACLLFLLTAMPLLLGLSRAGGRFTIGDSGRWNYLTEVNQAGPLWYMQDIGSGRGRFIHPPQKIYDFPPVYSFVGPIGGTMPAWYDPAYWAMGVEARVHLRRQLTVIYKNARKFFDLIFTNEGGFLAVLVLLCLAGATMASLSAMLRLWPIWIPAIAALCMYMLVLVQERYVAVFLILLWTAFFSSIRLSRNGESRRLVWGVICALIVAFGIPMALSAAEDFHDGIKHSGHPQWEISRGLRHMGVQPGDRVGRIGGTHRVEWAQLLGVRVIAEISHEDAEYFWTSSPLVQSQVIESFRNVGATAIVAQQIPPYEVIVPPPGWRKLGKDFYAYLLKAPAELSSTSESALRPVQ